MISVRCLQRSEEDVSQHIKYIYSRSASLDLYHIAAIGTIVTSWENNMKQIIASVFFNI